MGMMDREYMIRKESENSLPCFPLKIQGFEFFFFIVGRLHQSHKRERLCGLGLFYGSKSRYRLLTRRVLRHIGPDVSADM